MPVREVDEPDAGLARRARPRLPTRGRASARKPVPGALASVSHLVAAIAVVADGRRASEHPRLGVEGREGAAEEARRVDPARLGCALPGLGPAAGGDAFAGEVHDRVDALEPGGVDRAPVRVPRHAFGAATDEAHDLVARRGQETAQAAPTSPLAPVTATFMACLRVP